MPDWIAISSSRATAIAYDEDQQVIYVRFADGAVYHYAECSQVVWDGLRASGVSIGRYITNVLDQHPYGRM